MLLLKPFTEDPGRLMVHLANPTTLLSLRIQGLPPYYSHMCYA